MSDAKLDPIIHPANRLKIIAMLDAMRTDVEFSVLKNALGVSDSVLSKQLKILTKAHYIETKKVLGKGRPSTWVCLTSKGKTAYGEHVAALKAILDGTL